MKHKNGSERNVLETLIVNNKMISSYSKAALSRRLTNEKIIFELFRLDLFQLFAALTSGSVQESVFGPHAIRIYGEVSERWAKMLGIRMSNDPHSLIADYVQAAHTASWDTGKPTENPFYAAARIFADSLGIWQGNEDGMHRLVTANWIGKQIILYVDTICKVAKTL